MLSFKHIVEVMMQEIAEVLPAAIQSRFGAFSLMIIAMSGITYFFFRNVSQYVKVFAFTLLFLGIGIFGYALYNLPIPVYATLSVHALDIGN